MHHGQHGRQTINILVTGHRGYIGSVLIPDLVKAGYRNITGLDSDLYRDSSLYSHPLKIREIEKDIRDITIDDVSGYDAVIHLAGLSNDPLGELRPELTYEINLDATRRLAELARKAGVKRFVFSSSCSVYGASIDVELTEDSEVNPVTTYAKSKYFAELELSKLANDNFCPVSLRNATVFGLSPKLRFDLVVNNLVAWACSTGKIFLKSDGTAWRPLVHVNDISSAIIKIITAPTHSVFNQVFNVGNNENNFQILEVAELIRNIIDGVEIVFAIDAEKDIRNYNVSFRKFMETFPDFQSTCTLENAIIDLYECFKSIDLIMDDFEGPKFNRIKCIRNLQDRNILDSRLRWNTELKLQAM
ncbi:MAG TPA: SDR family oxidoreductase [Gammaproteobacteria bacterium]|nr:SDR family oxidoreductase [Gammaproteobacteria bacterium]